MTEIVLPGISLLRFDWSFIASHMYLVIIGHEALVIDPADTDEVREYIINEQIKSCTVLLTHEHFDHISGVGLLRSLCSCNVICSRACADRIRSKSGNLSDKSDVIVMFNSGMSSRHCHIEPFICEADSSFEGELQFQWHNCKINAFTTPGHSDGSVCILLNGEYMFSGDTLLAVPTITRLPGGNKAAFKDITLPRLREYRLSVKQVFPGHGEPGTLNEFLKKYDNPQKP